jgi:hypothetical protein
LQIIKKTPKKNCITKSLSSSSHAVVVSLGNKKYIVTSTLTALKAPFDLLGWTIEPGAATFSTGGFFDVPGIWHEDSSVPLTGQARQGQSIISGRPPAPVSCRSQPKPSMVGSGRLNRRRRNAPAGTALASSDQAAMVFSRRGGNRTEAGPRSILR